MAADAPPEVWRKEIERERFGARQLSEITSLAGAVTRHPTPVKIYWLSDSESHQPGEKILSFPAAFQCMHLYIMLLCTKKKWPLSSVLFLLLLFIMNFHQRPALPQGVASHREPCLLSCVKR